MNTRHDLKPSDNARLELSLLCWNPRQDNWEAFSHGQNGREKCFDNQQSREPIVSRACVGVKGQIPMRSKQHWLSQNSSLQLNTSFHTHSLSPSHAHTHTHTHTHARTHARTHTHAHTHTHTHFLSFFLPPPLFFFIDIYIFIVIASGMHHEPVSEGTGESVLLDNKRHISFLLEFPLKQLKLVLSLVLSSLIDYYNALVAGSPTVLLDQIQRAINCSPHQQRSRIFPHHSFTL